MKIRHLIAVSLLTLAACTKKSSSTSTPSGTSTSGDTVFNGSYFKVTYNGRSYHSKNAALRSGSILVNISSQTLGAPNILQIQIVSGFGIYGLSNSNLVLIGTGTGTYTFSDGVGTGLSSIIQMQPSVVTYTAKTGTANITHNGGDYLEGTFSTTLEGSGFTYPATGSFKIYH